MTNTPTKLEGLILVILRQSLSQVNSSYTFFLECWFSTENVVCEINQTRQKGENISILFSLKETVLGVKGKNVPNLQEFEKSGTEKWYNSKNDTIS